MDFSVDTRLRNGVFLQGGVSSGKDMNDYCDIIDEVPEALTPAVPQATIRRLWHRRLRHTGRVLPPGDAVPDAVEGTGVVHAAWYGIRMSGTFQSLYGPPIAATNIYNNANRTATTTLARPFTPASRR